MASSRKAIPNVLVVFVSLVVLAYNLFVLHTVQRLESTGCKCALDWRRTFIARYTTFVIAWVAGILILGIIQPSVLGSKVMSFMGMIVNIVGLVNLILSVQYILQLRRDNCKCSASLSRTMWEITLWALVFSYAIAFMIIICAALVVGIHMRGK
jgi:hypothetical protein